MAGHLAIYRIVNSHTWRWLWDLPLGVKVENSEGIGVVKISRGVSPPWLSPSVDVDGEKIKQI